MKFIKTRIVGIIYNEIENIIIPNNLQYLFNSKNQIIISIILQKIGVSAKIISIICLFL